MWENETESAHFLLPFISQKVVCRCRPIPSQAQPRGGAQLRLHFLQGTYCTETFQVAFLSTIESGLEVLGLFHSPPPGSAGRASGFHRVLPGGLPVSRRAKYYSSILYNKAQNSTNLQGSTSRRLTRWWRTSWKSSWRQARTPTAACCRPGKQSTCKKNLLHGFHGFDFYYTV